MGPQPAPALRSLVVFEDLDQGLRDLNTLSMSAGGDRGLTVLPALGAALVYLTREERAVVSARGGNSGVFEMLPRRVPDFFPSAAEKFPARVQGLISVDVASGARTVRAADLPGADGAATWCLDQIGVRVGTQCDSRVRIAVIDTGIDADHPDFAGRIVAMRGLQGGSDCVDRVGHGTHCAGIAAGAAVPKGGPRYGTAAGAGLLIAKAFNDAGAGSDEEVLLAVHWAVEQGARVVNLSLGSLRKAGDPASVAYEQVARRLLDRNVVLVAAVGNASRRPTLVAPVANPAACRSVVAVAAVDKDGEVALFSCGDVDGVGSVDLCAPGVDVWSAFPGAAYSCLSGTSMAAPHVAGVAALLMGRDAGASATEICRQMVEMARGMGDVKDYGMGLVQWVGV